MADPVVALALGTLRDFLIEETKFLYGVSNQVRGLETQLKEMRCLLKDAERRQHESNSVRNWIAEIRDLAYRAEDVVETYAVEISSRKGKGFGELIKRFSCAFNECLSIHQIGSQLSEIVTEIERVHKSMRAYGIKEIIQRDESSSVSCASNENQQWKRQTYPIEIEDCFVGKENDLNRLVSLIVDAKQHRVISIWGMGGIPKTTIARKVYNHFETQRHFESFAWVCVTPQCHIRSVLEDVLKQLIPQRRADIMNLSNTELVQLLCEVQKAKRCFIVLDDLWQIDHWNGLKNAFIVTGLENKILLTTRKQNIAAVGFSYELELLNVDDGWELLKKKAFSLNKVPVEEKLFQKIGKEMVHKCGYLPLGISLIGGILSNKKSLVEWEFVNKNVSACLYKGEGVDGNEIGGVVDLIYEDMPSYLKPCFLYLSRYREDQIIYVTELYKLWIAEGMVSLENHRREGSLMDIAESYLSELVSRCIVQVHAVLGDQRYRACKLHDVVRELCLSKAKDEDFRLKVMDYHAGKLDIINPSFLGIKARHLIIYFTGQEDVKLEDGFTSFNCEINNQSIRSLLFLRRDERKIEFSRNVINFGKLKLLRVLVFENCTFEGGKLPREIVNLICLRHLELRYCVLDELPVSIGNWTCLYTLDLFGTWDVRIPNVLNKMIRLKHLYFPLYNKEKTRNYLLRLEGLEELETLNGFSSLVHDLKSISKIKNLRELRASIHDNKTLSEIIYNIQTSWNNLRVSRLEIEEGCDLTSTEECLAVLKNVLACSTLHFLWIKVPIRKLALAVYDQCCGTRTIFPGLVSLYLVKCEIEDDPMEILEKLPLLKDLYLRNRSYEGEVMTCHSMGFPKLKTLQFKGLSNLREWRIEEGAMPSLDKLKIDSCQNVKMIPDGLKFITTLQHLHIAKMPELGKRVSPMLDDGREGEDYYIVRHVPSILVH